MTPAGEPGTGLPETCTSSRTWAPDARGPPGSRVTGQLASRPGRDLAAPVPAWTVLPPRVHPRRRGSQTSNQRALFSFRCFWGTRSTVINSHDAECLRLPEAVRAGLVKTRVLTGLIPLPPPPAAHSSPGRRAGRKGPGKSLAHLPWSLTHAGAGNTASALPAGPTPGLSPGSPQSVPKTWAGRRSTGVSRVRVKVASMQSW